MSAVTSRGLEEEGRLTIRAAGPVDITDTLAQPVSFRSGPAVY
jgi:hypothetical protein